MFVESSSSTARPFLHCFKLKWCSSYTQCLQSASFISWDFKFKFSPDFLLSLSCISQNKRWFLNHHSKWSTSNDPEGSHFPSVSDVDECSDLSRLDVNKMTMTKDELLQVPIKRIGGLVIPGYSLVLLGKAANKMLPLAPTRGGAVFPTKARSWTDFSQQLDVCDFCWDVSNRGCLDSTKPCVCLCVCDGDALPSSIPFKQVSPPLGSVSGVLSTSKGGWHQRNIIIRFIPGLTRSFDLLSHDDQIFHLSAPFLRERFSELLLSGFQFPHFYFKEKTKYFLFLKHHFHWSVSWSRKHVR